MQRKYRIHPPICRRDFLAQVRFCLSPDRSRAVFPSVVTYSWSNASLDHTIAHALRKLSDAVHAVALKDGQNISHAAVYPNNALSDTPLEDIYGENVPKLPKVRAEVDPEDVMGGSNFDNTEAHFFMSI